VRHIILHILISILITAGGIWLYNQNFSTQFATIDMSAYADRLKSEYIQGKLSKEALNEKLSALSNRLKTEYKHYVVLRKGAVISGKIQEIIPGK